MKSGNGAVKAVRGFFPVVAGEHLELSQAGAMVVGSAGDLTVREGGAQLMGAAGNLTVTQGGAQLMAVGGDAEIRQGGAVALAARSVRVDEGFVGMVLSPSVTVGAGSRVLMTTPQAAAFGAAFGALVGAALLVLKRRS